MKKKIQISREEYEKILKNAIKFAISHKDHRVGQGLFNALNEINPELAKKIKNGHQVDPFHDDRNIKKFCSYVEDHIS